MDKLCIIKGLDIVSAIRGFIQKLGSLTGKTRQGDLF